MAKTTDTYTQCRLYMVETMISQVAWIPTCFAVQGKQLRLEQEDWTLWEVTMVYGTDSAENVERNARQYKYFREATDI